MAETIKLPQAWAWRLAAYLSVLAKGIELRARRHPGRSLDIIIAENIHDGVTISGKALEALLPPDFPLAENVGLVETSIGQMVPIMRKEDLAADPLLLFAEEYNEFIVDKHGFKSSLPQIPTLNPVENIQAYVDRKLFIQTWATRPPPTSASAGRQAPLHLAGPRAAGLASRVAHRHVPVCRRSHRQYPDDLTPASLEATSTTSWAFCEPSLGDTIYRVGRDLYRKLACTTG